MLPWARAAPCAWVLRWAAAMGLGSLCLGTALGLGAALAQGGQACLVELEVSKLASLSGASPCSWMLVPNGFGIRDFGFRGLNSGFANPKSNLGFGIRDAGLANFRFRGSGFGIGGPGLRALDSGLGIRDSPIPNRTLGLGIRIRNSGFGICESQITFSRITFQKCIFCVFFPVLNLF